MLKKNILFVFLFFLSICAKAQSREQHDALQLCFDTTTNTTPTYQEGISFLNELERQFPMLIQVNEVGATDTGLPLHEVIFQLKGKFTPQENTDNYIVFINNGIHPGEPDGINATFSLLRLLCKDEKFRKQFENITLITIPFYNVGGTLNRNSYSRVNQDNPESYGFRGNAKNLDLNRDFVKCDSKNAQTFTQLFQKWQPLVYLETHVSNGADYQYTLTHLETQPIKLGGKMGNYLRNTFTPALEKALKAQQQEMTPYVNVFGYDPKEGWAQFMDSPRYSTGYTTLFQTFGMLTETHMLKSFPKRVEATSLFIKELLHYVQKNGEELQAIREEDQQHIKSQEKYVLQWQLDSSSYRSLDFKGYESSIEKSKVSGLDRMKYHQDKPYHAKVKFYNHYTPKLEVTAPKAYLIPQGYTEVLERLRWNNVQLLVLEKDSVFEAESYTITNYQTVRTPYESHYLHYNTQIRTEKIHFQARKGDVLVYMNQQANRYIVEMLEPQGVDSFFNWNFFDGILQQKEHFSPYVFEDLAIQILEDNPLLKDQLEQKRKENPDFAANAYLQLDFIYQNSKYYETSHNRYPVLRIL